MNYTFRKATSADIEAIWQILQYAILRRKMDGSTQWQDGYPNPGVLNSDIKKDAAFVLLQGDKIIGYIAIMINDEPQYTEIQGKWLSDGDFVVFHRVALSKAYSGKGLGKLFMNFVEQFATKNNIYSIKADTNFDNVEMKKLLENFGYTLCGEVHFRGTPRIAYEKVIANHLVL